jgi:hypothetical protein
MATPKTKAKTSKAGTHGRKTVTPASTRAVEHAYGVPVPEALHDAIEAERGNLAKLDSLLACLAISLEYGDKEDEYGPYYSDIAELARGIVQRVMNALDSMTLTNLLRQTPAKAALSVKN